MSKDLVKMNEQKAIELLQAHNIRWRVGDILISKDSNISKVHSVNEKGCVLLRWEGGNDWEKYEFDPKYPISGTTKWEYLRSYIKIKMLNNETIEELEKRIMLEAINTKKPKIEESDETSLAIFNKEYYIKLKEDMQTKKDKFEIMQRMMERKRHDMMCIVREFEVIVSKVRKVIGQIELYLGINEDIIQLQEGETSSEPITLRQHILYMDEEYGATEDGGMDFEKIEEFDDWLLQNENYKRMIPEEKGIVVFRVRRNMKDYVNDNPEQLALNSFLNQPNMMTYLLIRNGQNIYRIWADIIIKPRLFPMKDELQKLMQDCESDHWKKEELEGQLFSYRQNLLLIKGLMDRSHVLKPFQSGIDIFKVETWDGHIVHIYDDEAALSERGTYKEWHEKLNNQIKRGTRVFFTGFPHYIMYGHENSGYDYHRFPVRPPGSPPKGIYNIEKIDKVEKSCFGNARENLVCMWMPNDEVWQGWGGGYKDRQKRVSFNLSRSDSFTLNYDLITFEDVDYFIKNRYERRNYLDILPVLRGIRKRRLVELEWEKGFVKTVASNHNVTEEFVWKGIEWWKTKVIWKRPLTKDDNKAWRMINGWVKRNEK